MRMLVARYRDARRIHTIVLRSPQQQGTPAGAYVQKTLTRLKTQLAADQIQLGLLRARQRHGGVAKIGTRIHPARVQPKRIKIIRQVVVKLHLARILRHGVHRHRSRTRQHLVPPVMARVLHRVARQ